MMMNKNSIYRITGFSTLLIAISFFAWGWHSRISRQVHTKVQPKREDSSGITVINPVLLEKYKAVFKKYDTLKRNYTISGTINIVDQADTSGNMNHVDFLFCKAGDSFYYKLGTTETINSGGLYIYIDHLGRTVLLTSQKKVSYDQEPGAFTDLGKEFKSEGYKISGSVNGSLQTISLNNEHNINCKEFSISYDTIALAMRHIYARMTNLQDPLKTDNQKLIDIQIGQWDGTADLYKFYKGDVVTEANGSWQVTDKYKKYHLTTM